MGRTTAATQFRIRTFPALGGSDFACHSGRKGLGAPPGERGMRNLRLGERVIPSKPTSCGRPFIAPGINLPGVGVRLPCARHSPYSLLSVAGWPLRTHVAGITMGIMLSTGRSYRVMRRHLREHGPCAAADVSDWPWSLDRATCQRKGPLTQHKLFPGTGNWSPPIQTATGNDLCHRMGRLGSSGTESRPGTNLSPLT
jgi:hypothetical protein